MKKIKITCRKSIVWSSRRIKLISCDYLCFYTLSNIYQRIGEMNINSDYERVKKPKLNLETCKNKN